jgi:uncharacterized BrkB/YihY/UPF0761 family membrane protein
MWLFLSAYAVLIGAEVNRAIERQTEPSPVSANSPQP